MGVFKKLFEKKEAGVTTAPVCAPYTVYAPLTGNVIPLAGIPDPIFSQGVLGPGCGIEPSEGAVYAPFHGEINTVAETKHAVGIVSPDGMEILIHVGIDTVAMNGKGFSVKVKEGQKVQKGDLLLNFSLEEIQDAGHPTTTAILMTNGADYAEVRLEADGSIKNGEVLLHAVK